MNGQIMNGQQKKTMVSIWLEQILRMKIGALVTIIGIIGGTIGYGIKATNWVTETNTDHQSIIDVKKMVDENKNQANKDKMQFTETLHSIDVHMTRIDGNLELVNQKIDDVKQYGQGNYRPETREAIRNAKR